MNAQQLAVCVDCRLDRAQQWHAPLLAAMGRYEINTPARQAAFLAQIAHESGRLAYVRELWGPTAAQQRYEGRKDLGNTQPGDGLRYRGRGLIQTTGRANYERTGKALGLPLIEQPQLLEMPEHAAMSAAWFWHAHGLNAIADKGDMRRITKIINGGFNGIDDRLALWGKAKSVLGVA